MESKSHLLRRQIGVVVPRSLDRPKHFAKQLHKHFSRHTLAQCQEVTANVFGHASWHNLSQSVKQGAAPGPFDEDIEPEAQNQRNNAQTALLALVLGDVEPDEEYAPPQEDGPAIEMMDPHNMLRLERAAKRYHRRSCYYLIWEMMPTMGVVPPTCMVQDTSLEPATQAVMAQFPQLIGRWWNKNIPTQPEIGSALASFDWNKDRPTSVLHFGAYWGELCMHYAGVIDWGMCMGTSYILANQHAAAILQRTQVFLDAVKGSSEWTAIKFDKEITDLHMSLQAEYLYAYMRDDMIQAPTSALRSSAKNALKILQSSSGRGGIWRN